MPFQKIFNPRQALNKAYLKLKINRSEIESFKKNLILLLDSANIKESEEFHKNLVSDFLKDTYYKQTNSINTKDRNDLVIHNSLDPKSTVGVIIEAKKENNKSEMVTVDSLNAKAFQELILYYMRERITHKNIEVKHLIITNLYEWFIFDAKLVDRLFAQDKEFIKSFEDFEAGRLADTTTDFFYKQIASVQIKKVEHLIVFSFFDLRKVEKILRNDIKSDDVRLVSIYKLLSPAHLLKLPFINDSNSLDKKFYTELLHIIGLEEVKEGNKKLIQRKKEKDRNLGSILEETIIQLDSSEKIYRLENPLQYGKTKDERLFNVALELSITWINRILFLKLLEAQLISYHKSDESLSFLNSNLVKSYDDLNSLFFQVLARKLSDRNVDVKEIYKKVPYLNSSLFEATELEHLTLMMSNLRDNKKIPILSLSVLKDNNGKKKTGELNTLEYLFEFLNSYDFTSEGSEEIQEENKSLINASVLGLIFEKINGYKDGSYFTPGFITMYMSKETIRRSVVQKFNETKNWECKDLDEIYNKIDNVQEANEIINSIKVCDPAVGSGHFLVSVLNEIIAVKHDLKILTDSSGKRLKEYEIHVENDELFVADEDGQLFEYNPKNKESQRIQEALFHEKQTIIENCLFGVDINPNSVKICRLRLWIELLKHAYYKNETELETLPNIDINIKCGNSLISRFSLDADLGKALKKSKWSVDAYRKAVDTYRNATSKDEKREMERFITDVKLAFRSEFAKNDAKELKLKKTKGEIFNLLNTQDLFEATAKQKKDLEKQIATLKADEANLESEIEDIKSNKIFENAFEWRFEFPEVLDDDGNFKGFDVVIGNPPYIRQELFSDIKPFLQERYAVYNSIADLLTYFVELGYTILKKKGVFQFIISNKFTRANYGKELRKFLSDNTNLTNFIDFSGIPVFDEATVDAAIVGYVNGNEDENNFQYANIQKADFIFSEFEKYLDSIKRSLPQKTLNENTWAFETTEVLEIKNKVESQGVPLENWNITINYGIKTGLNDAFVIDGEKRKQLIDEDPKSKEIIKRMLRGRDIQKYYPTYEDLWLVYIPWHFPLHEDESIQGVSAIAESKFKKVYPAIYNHITKYKKDLEKRNKAETGIRYEWYALQRFGSNYWKDFEKPKIIYPEMTKFLNFTLDLEDKYYTNNKNFIFTGERLYWLTSFFNSQLWGYCFRDNFPELLGGTRELRKVFFEKIPVKQITDKEELPFKKLVEKIIGAKKKDPSADTSKWEKEIDEMVYKFYGLTEEEIKIVEGSVK